MLELTKENILDLFNKGYFEIYCETKEEYKDLLYICEGIVLKEDICCEEVFILRDEGNTLISSDTCMPFVNYKEFEEIYFSKNKKEVTKNKKMNIEKYRNQIIHFLDNDLRFMVDFVTRFKIPMENEDSYSSAILNWLTSYEEDKIELEKSEYNLIDIYYRKALPNNTKQKLKQYNIIYQLKEEGSFKNVDLEMTIGELKDRMCLKK